MTNAAEKTAQIMEEGWDDINFSALLNRSLRVFFRDALRVSITNPVLALHFFRTVIRQRRAAKTRAGFKALSVQVPPIILFSVTNRCNLRCKGCYHQALHRSTDDEMSGEELRRVVHDAGELGVSFFVLAGGEPLIRPEIVDIMLEHPRIIFLMFTNGLLIDEELLRRFRRSRNVIPVISIEGYEEHTDDRRGAGVFGRLLRTLDMMRKSGMFYSVSITVTRSNFDTVTSERFIGDLVRRGCKFFLFVEYSPIREDTENWVISLEQRARLMSRMHDFRKRYRSLFIEVPGDEEKIGGCLSAGRGFVHIGADGALEPCPFAPFSDANVRDLPLRDALQSEFLRKIRLNHDQLEETEGGCALWVKREWVRTLLHP
jgi:MoaA/NifB/PqqE/SkfB family radical SAM enzyme